MRERNTFKNYNKAIKRIDEINDALKYINILKDELSNLTNSVLLFEKAVSKRRSSEWVESSRWSEFFKKESLCSYGDALKLLSDSNYEVKIIESDEVADQFDVDFMYHVVPVKNEAFWLDTRFSEDDCYELCNMMGWEVVE